MGSVVWLMYLADVATSISTVLCVGAIITLFTVGGYKLASFIEEFDAKPVRAYVIACVVAFVVASLIPSKETIYAAAAVTAGEKALNTPTGDKAVRALNAWLDRQIAGEKDQRK